MDRYSLLIASVIIGVSAIIVSLINNQHNRYQQYGSGQSAAVIDTNTGRLYLNVANKYPHRFYDATDTKVNGKLCD